MRTIDELGISKTPWAIGKMGVPRCIISSENEIVAVERVTKYGDANARLISAAPELYECLYDITKELCEKCLYEENGVCKGSNRCYVQRYKKSLAKASGEEVAND